MTGRRYTIQPCRDRPQGVHGRRVGIDDPVVEDALRIVCSIVELAVAKNRRGGTVGKDVAVAAGERGLIAEVLVDFDVELLAGPSRENDFSIVVGARDSIAGGVGLGI